MKAQRKEEDTGYSYTLELNGNSGTSFIKKPITEERLADQEAQVDAILTDVLEKLVPNMKVHLAQTDKGWELTSEQAAEPQEEAKDDAKDDAQAASTPSA